MGRHQLVERAPRADLLEVVDRIGGLHAQVMSSAELTAWARVEDLEPEAVAEALWSERSLVKLWAMRGTLHLLPARTLGTWLGALGTYDHFLKGAWLRGFGISREELEALIVAIGEALDGELLTREQLGAEVARVVGTPELAEKIHGSWGAYLKPASFRGRLCFAPNAGQRVRFTAPSSWLDGRLEVVDGEAARLEVTRRYLGAFAPVSREDFARWWSVGPAPAGRMLQALGDEAVELNVDGSPRWMLRDHAAQAEAADPRRVARLLPGFDTWVIGAARDSAAQLQAAHKKRVYRDQGWISPVLLVNGRMDGVWKHERKGKRLLVTIEPFGRVPKWARAQADAEAERLAAFLGGELAVDWAG
jgi:Winged helix DNA-binding domain